jgi:hypothetical protein
MSTPKRADGECAKSGTEKDEHTVNGKRDEGTKNDDPSLDTKNKGRAGWTTGTSQNLIALAIFASSSPPSKNDNKNKGFFARLYRIIFSLLVSPTTFQN